MGVRVKSYSKGGQTREGHGAMAFFPALLPRGEGGGRVFSGVCFLSELLCERPHCFLPVVEVDVFGLCGGFLCFAQLRGNG